MAENPTYLLSLVAYSTKALLNGFVSVKAPNEPECKMLDFNNKHGIITIIIMVLEMEVIFWVHSQRKHTLDIIIAIGAPACNNNGRTWPNVVN